MALGRLCLDSRARVDPHLVRAGDRAFIPGDRELSILDGGTYGRSCLLCRWLEKDCAARERLAVECHSPRNRLAVQEVARATARGRGEDEDRGCANQRAIMPPPARPSRPLIEHRRFPVHESKLGEKPKGTAQLAIPTCKGIQGWGVFSLTTSLAWQCVVNRLYNLSWSPLEAACRVSAAGEGISDEVDEHA